MKADGIEYIAIQNFKAFREVKKIEIKRKHVLVYGPNGSGKSSLYFALYTLFQCSTKTLDKIEKYFDGSDENLKNIYEAAMPSYIELKTKASGKDYDFKLDITGIAGDNANLKELNQSSEFISHRLLINFYNFRNSREIDLISVFDRDILPYNNGVNNFKDKDLGSVINEIKTKLNKTDFRSWRDKDKIESGDLEKLNDEIGLLVKYINDNATKYLNDNFKNNDLVIKLTLKGKYSIVKGKKTYDLVAPIYKLSIDQIKDGAGPHPVDRPQSFLNEARLTRIGIAVRFCLLPRRPQTVPIKVLALDDMLISMDMDNRSELVEMLLAKYNSDYQLFLFTHDLEFYNEIKRYTGDETANWVYLEFNEILADKQLNYRDGKTAIQRAKRYFEDHDLDGCALELRKIGEGIVTNFLEKRMNIVFDHKEFVTFGQKLNEAKNQIDKINYGKFQRLVLNSELDFTDPDFQKISSEDFAAVKADAKIDGKKKAKIIAARKEFFQLLFDLNKENFKALQIIDEVRRLKDRILNHAAHPASSALFRKEVEDGIKLIEEFDLILKSVKT